MTLLPSSFYGERCYGIHLYLMGGCHGYSNIVSAYCHPQNSTCEDKKVDYSVSNYGSG